MPEIDPSAVRVFWGFICLLVVSARFSPVGGGQTGGLAARRPPETQCSIPPTQAEVELRTAGIYQDHRLAINDHGSVGDARPDR